MRHFVFILFLILGFNSCIKDEPIDPTISPFCLDFDMGSDQCDFGGPIFRKGSPNFDKPCFNPNNPDEFVYHHNNAIWKFTISSKQAEVIRSDVRPLTQLDWGSSGWITYTANDWNVWVVKDDGSQLRVLVEAPRAWGPEFNFLGDYILYGRRMEFSNAELDNRPDLRELYKMMIVSVDSHPVDSFCRRFGPEKSCNPWDFSSWSSDDRVAAEYRPNSLEYGLSVYDLDGNIIDILYNTSTPDEENDFLQDIEWHPDNSKVFFTDGFGLKVVNVLSKDVEIIKESCESKTYFDISISNDGQTILASREISTYSDCTVTSRMDLVLMDVDGSNERMVELSQ